MFEPEERWVAERIKDFIKSKNPSDDVHIMLRNGHILYIDNYSDMVDSGKINPQDAYVYIRIYWATYFVDFYYPLLVWYDDLFRGYLSKLGFHFGYTIVPATGLKYVTDTVKYYKGYLSIEVSNLDTAVNNTNLRNIVVEVLGAKLVSGERKLTEEEYEKILSIYASQKLFAGHNFEKAKDIIDDYYIKYNLGNFYEPLAKEAVRIAIDYDRIFNPYRVCYETKKWNEVDCSTIT